MQTGDKEELHCNCTIYCIHHPIYWCDSCCSLQPKN